MVYKLPKSQGDIVVYKLPQVALLPLVDTFFSSRVMTQVQCHTQGLSLRSVHIRGTDPPRCVLHATTTQENGRAGVGKNGAGGRLDGGWRRIDNDSDRSLE